MLSKLQKKYIVLIAAGIIILGALLVYFLVFPKADEELVRYLLEEFNISELEKSNNGDFFDKYLYLSIYSKIGQLAADENRADILRARDLTELEKYEQRAKEMEVLFLNQCREDPKECHPFFIILPHCMVQWNNHRKQGVDTSEFRERMSENRVFIEALDYWRDYFSKKEWQKEDLAAVKGVVGGEYLCGDIKNIDAESWSKRIIRVETETVGPSEKIKYNHDKIEMLKVLHGGNNILQMPSYEGLAEEVCFTFPEEATVLAGDICDFYYYNQSKIFCMQGTEISRDEIAKYFKERHLNPEKLICQIFSLRGYRHQ